MSKIPLKYPDYIILEKNPDNILTYTYNLPVITHRLQSIKDSLYTKEISYNKKTGHILQELWFKNGLLHRDEDLPANIVYKCSNTRKISTWYNNGEIHRENDLPAILTEAGEFANGDFVVEYVVSEQWYMYNLLHRVSKPAYVLYYENGNIQKEQWIVNNKNHREDGPAIILYYPNTNINEEWWCMNGNIHRHNGPAKVFYYRTGNKREESWCINNLYYKETGPNHITYFETGNKKREFWYKNNSTIEEPVLHNIHNPALVYYLENGKIESAHWYVDNIEFNPEIIKSICNIPGIISNVISYYKDRFPIEYQKILKQNSTDMFD